MQLADFQTTAQRIRTLAAELVAARDGEAGSEERKRDSLAAAEQAWAEDQKSRKARFEHELRAARDREREERERIEGRAEERRGRVRRAAEAIRGGLNAELDAERRRAEEEIAIAREKLAGQEAEERAPVEERQRRWEALLPRVREQYQDAESALRRFATRYGVDAVGTPAWSEEIDVDADPDRMADEAQEAFDDALARMESVEDRMGSGFARTGHLVVYHGLILVLAAGGAVLAFQLVKEPLDVVPIPAAAAVLMILLALKTRSVRKRYGRIVAEIGAAITGQAQRFDRHARAALAHLDGIYDEQAEAYTRKMNQAELRILSESADRCAPDRRLLDDLELREKRALERVEERYRDWIGAHEAGAKKDREELESAHRAEQERAEEEHRAAVEAIETGSAEETRRIRERRESALSEFTGFAAEVNDAADRAQRSWTEIDAAKLELPEEFPALVPFGRLEVAPEESPSEFELPLATTFPEHGSLLVRHTPAERDRALAVLSNVVLRVLGSFPAGKARLTLLDPVGLGQSFSALMHLADHDEDLVNSRIWTETAHIERRLADLTEHIEKVIQKYLRNKYHTIGEYNAEAGELQEPYHFLVVADFPTAFSDIAVERLASIVSSGPRCGVYTLLAHDLRQEVPPPIDLDTLRRNGPSLLLNGEACRLEGVDGEVVPERPPSAEVTSTLLDRIGRLSVDAAQIELPFTAVAPEEGAVWSGSTETGIRVPIGRTGAERLQYLDLGRGTAQHALVAGRTGSGKSTLFHVMITNMSLWFSPEEIEFYLIDFKKGVEFKPFATHALPHARVVAIESDREFGLSVLRAVDAELARRGDLFRGQGVQDLATYRRRGTGETLPRTMLLIDEFQEFFTDDDAVAHQSALLLDRFVRQGRAFGIHVVLGSQTLSGIYTLARGTLGQMGVRIALQCNEADSYLILSEDNGVARLLSRPGEAIYNDKSGLLEGNNPFQVVWLPEGEEERHLVDLHRRPGPRREAVVFEGNQAADLAKNTVLAEQLTSGARPGPGEDLRVWLGEPNAIKGPTEGRFAPASGSNLLIVGQRREAAFAMMASATLSLLGQLGPDDLDILLLDGGGYEAEFGEHLKALLHAVPKGVRRFGMRDAPDAVAEVAAKVREREEGEGGRKPVFLFAFGLQRLRMLRREDDFAMPSYGEEAVESSGDQFATIITEGPPQGIHTIIWCDTVANLQRTLSRRTLREFDMRVLFQMSAADSSEMIETSSANQLGLTNALLALESQGTFEKFRPYAVPDGELLRRLAATATAEAGSRTGP